MKQFSIFNKKRSKIKKLIIDLLDKLKTSNSIKTYFYIVYKDNATKKSEVKTLTPFLLSQNNDLLFSEIICG